MSIDVSISIGPLFFLPNVVKIFAALVKRLLVFFCFFVFLIIIFIIWVLFSIGLELLKSDLCIHFLVQIAVNFERFLFARFRLTLQVLQLVNESIKLDYKYAIKRTRNSIIYGIVQNLGATEVLSDVNL